MSLTLDTAFEGAPFGEVGDALTLDTAFNGLPWYAVPDLTPVDLAASTSQAQTITANGLDVADLAGSSSQVQTSASTANVSDPVATSQAQTSAATLTIRDPWTLVSSEAKRTGTAHATSAFNLEGGNLVLFGVAYFSRNASVDVTITVADTAGNTYVAGPAATVVISAATHKTLQWFYCANALSHATNVIEATLSVEQSIGEVCVMQWDVNDAPVEVDSTVTKAPSSNSITLISDAISTTGRGVMAAGLTNYFDESGGSFTTSDFSNLSETSPTGAWAYRTTVDPLTTTVTFAGTDSNIRAMSVLAMKETTSFSYTGDTRQGQTAAASVGVASDVAATTSQAQSVQATDIISIGTETSQAQSVAAESAVETVAVVAVGQAQSVSSVASGEVLASVETYSGQSVSASATPESSLASESSQVQALVAVGEIELYAEIGTGQAQTTAASSGLSSDAAAQTGQAQTASADSGAGVALAAATSQAQTCDVIVTYPGDTRTRQGQTAAAEVGVAVDVTVQLQQGQSIAAQNSVDVDTAVETGQAQHIGNSTFLSAGIDLTASTSQVQRIVSASLEIIVPLVGTLVGQRKVRVAVSGEAATRPQVMGDTSIKSSVSGHINVRRL